MDLQKILLFGLRYEAQGLMTKFRKRKYKQLKT